MKAKRYGLRGVVAGIIAWILFVIHFFGDGTCFGTFMNPDGTSGSVCPEKFSLFWFKMVPVYYYIISFVAFLAFFTFFGWLYGKIKNRKTVSLTTNH